MIRSFLVTTFITCLLAACTPAHDVDAPLPAHETSERTAVTQTDAAAPETAATTAKASTEESAASANEVDYSCQTDADCSIKNVGNCCGYYPACVNVDSPTFPERVKAECAASGTSGICGYPELSGCQCVAGHCEGINAAATIPITTH